MRNALGDIAKVVELRPGFTHAILQQADLQVCWRTMHMRVPESGRCLLAWGIGDDFVVEHIKVVVYNSIIWGRLS